jgi:hypothetical protein
MKFCMAQYSWLRQAKMGGEELESRDAFKCSTGMAIFVPAQDFAKTLVIYF